MKVHQHDARRHKEQQLQHGVVEHMQDRPGQRQDRARVRQRPLARLDVAKRHCRKARQNEAYLRHRRTSQRPFQVHGEQRKQGP